MDIHFAIQGIMHHIGEACHQCLVLCFHHAHRKYLRILQKITIILHHIKTESVLAQCPFAQFLYKGLFQVPVPDRLCHCIQSVCQAHVLLPFFFLSSAIEKTFSHREKVFLLSLFRFPPLALTTSSSKGWHFILSAASAPPAFCFISLIIAYFFKMANTSFLN